MVFDLLSRDMEELIYSRFTVWKKHRPKLKYCISTLCAVRWIDRMYM